MGKKVRKRRSWLTLLLSLALFAAMGAYTVIGVRQSGESAESEGLRQAEQAVREAAVGCYALYGVYPESYEDLKAKSGVAVDEDVYKVFYEIFASNIMPEITVVRLKP